MVSDIERRFDEALAWHRSGNLNHAKAHYESILSLWPDHAQTLKQLGILHLQKGQHAAGIQLLRASLRQEDAQADVHAHIGDALQVMQRFEAALDSYDLALANRANFAHVHYKRGNALQALQRHLEAVQCYDRALGLNPHWVNCYLKRGNAWHELGMHEQALADYDRAIAQSPADAKAHANRGVALHAMGRNLEAVMSYDRAICLEPNDALPHSNRGNALRCLNRHAEAINSCQQAIILRPDFAPAHWNLSLVQLALGNYREGWRSYEWRWKGGPSRDYVRHFDRPLWLGDALLQGRTLLLYAEQGLGDTLQMCRYLPHLRALDARVVLEVQPALVKLLVENFPQIDIVSRGGGLPEFDFQCPMMSLPLAFKTTLQTIPASVPYLGADGATNKLWVQRLGMTNKWRIGLAWSGSPAHANDRNRSVALAPLQRLFTNDVEWHSLQKDVAPIDRPQLPLLGIHDHSTELTDFAQTAGLVQNMDLVITVDTSVAHLAGAMGKPVWLLLPFAAEYRWLVDRSDSPWYPTASLYRQQAPGDWQSIVDQVAMEVRRLVLTPKNR